MRYSIILIFLIFIVSCSNDTVIPPTIEPPEGEFDSSRIEWTGDTVFFTLFSQMMVFDTNNIYGIRFPNYIFHYDGNKFTYTFTGNDMTTSAFHGYDKNNFFLGGIVDIYNTTTSFLKVKKYNGSSFTEIPFTSDTLTGYAFNCVEAFSETEVWFATNKGETFLYNGSGFTKYKIDTLYSIVSDLKFVKQNGELLIAALRYRIEDTTQVVYPDTLKIYKFNGNGWETIYSEHFNNERINSPSLEFISGRICRLKRDGIYEFTGNSFVKLVNIDSKYFGLGSFSGELYNNILFPIIPYSGSKETFLVHWNGEKLSMEFNDYHITSKLYFVQNTYILFMSHNLHISVLIGRERNQK